MMCTMPQHTTYIILLSFTNTETNNHSYCISQNSTVSVRPDWRRVEEVDLSKLSKGTSPLSNLVDNSLPKNVEDLAWCGFLDQYNDQYDKVTTRTATQLKRVETKEFYPVTTTDDPVIEKLAIEGKGTVFATDAILAHLMTCPRSVYPWDIVVQKLPTGALFVSTVWLFCCGSIDRSNVLRQLLYFTLTITFRFSSLTNEMLLNSTT